MGKDIGKLSKRYANALYKSVVQELGTEGIPTPAQQIASSFKDFAKLWLQDSEFSSSISNPMFDASERLKALIKIAQMMQLQDILCRSLRVIFEHDRIVALPQIAEAFSDLADAYAGVVAVEITVARQLLDSEVSFVESQLKEQIGALSRFKWSVNPEIIGGMIVSYQGKVVDGSLSGRLEQIERRLSA